MDTLHQNHGNINHNPWAGRVTVTELKPMEKPGNIRAFATVVVADALTIHGVKVVQQPGQTPWVSLPQQQSGNKWYPLMQANKQLNEIITDVVLGVWRDSTVLGLNR